MLTQIEAEIETNGNVVLLQPIHLKKRSRAIITIIDAEVSSPSASNDKPIPEGGLEEMFGSVDLGYATGTDNESIDRDLAEEYAGRR